MIELSEIRDAALIAELISRGYRVPTMDNGAGWETASAFSIRHGRNQNYLANLLYKGRVVPGLELDRAKGGRLVYVRASPATENWMRSRRKALGANVYDY